MQRLEPITSFEDPRLLPYRNMRRQHDHAAQEIFIAEGEKVVRRLLETNLEIISILLPDRWIAEYEPLITARGLDIPVFTAPISVLENLVGFPLYQGLLAVVKIPPPLALSEVLSKVPHPSFLVAVDHLSNAENMGALVRSCVAFGAHALIVGEGSCTPYLRRAVRNSMGTIFKLPLVFSQDLSATLLELRQRNINCIAAHPHTLQKTIFEADFTRDCCVVLGSEGAGVSENVLASCNELVVIPMHNQVDSLNVGAAAAVFLYEVARQRS